jgi:hypothetical protein
MGGAALGTLGAHPLGLRSPFHGRQLLTRRPRPIVGGLRIRPGRRKLCYQVLNLVPEPVGAFTLRIPALVGPICAFSLVYNGSFGPICAIYGRFSPIFSPIGLIIRMIQLHAQRGNGGFQHADRASQFRGRLGGMPRGLVPGRLLCDG